MREDSVAWALVVSVVVATVEPEAVTEEALVVAPNENVAAGFDAPLVAVVVKALEEPLEVEEFPNEKEAPVDAEDEPVEAPAAEAAPVVEAPKENEGLLAPGVAVVAGLVAAVLVEPNENPAEAAGLVAVVAAGLVVLVVVEPNEKPVEAGVDEAVELDAPNENPVAAAAVDLAGAPNENPAPAAGVEEEDELDWAGAPKENPVLAGAEPVDAAGVEELPPKLKENDIVTEFNLS